MKTIAQSRARELSRMHPADRELSKGIYPQPNGQSWVMPITSAKARPAAQARDIATVTEGQALRDIERAIATARGAKVTLSRVLLGVDPGVVRDIRGRALKTINAAPRLRPGGKKEKPA